MDTILSRIKAISEYEGTTITSMERAIGASKGVLSRAISNGTDIQAKWLQSIVENYPHISSVWLLTGQGKMLTDIPKEEVIESKKEHQTETTPAPPHYHHTIEDYRDNEGIPFVPIEAAAGIFQGGEKVLRSECELYHIPIFSDADYLISIKGDSMQPTYSSGDIVACKWANTSSSFFQWGRVYVVDTEEGVLIKRVFEGKKEGYLRLVSDNERYPPIEVPHDEIYHIALVIGTMRSE